MLKYVNTHAYIVKILCTMTWVSREAASACDISVCLVVKCKKYTSGYRNQHFV